MSEYTVKIERLYEDEVEGKRGKIWRQKVISDEGDFVFWGLDPLLKKAHAKDSVVLECKEKTGMFQGKVQYTITKVVKLIQGNNATPGAQGLPEGRAIARGSVESALPAPLSESTLQELIAKARAMVAKSYEVTPDDLSVADPIIAATLNGLVEIEKEKFALQLSQRIEANKLQNIDRVKKG